MAKNFKRKATFAVRDTINIEVDYGGMVKDLEFNVLPQVSGIDVLRMTNAENDANGALQALQNVIRRCMDDSDKQVRAGWKQTALPGAYRDTDGEVKDVPEDLADLPPELREDIRAQMLPRSYRGPDGKIYPFSDSDTALRWADPQNHTSRRRWDALCDDDSAVVQMDQLQEISSWLIEQATGRPTQPSR